MSEFSSRDVSRFDEPNVARHTVKKEKDAMKNARRFSFLAVTLIALASMLALHAPAGAQTNGNRLEASFTESAASITNRIADLGVFQIINTGTGTLEGFGPATMVLASRRTGRSSRVGLGAGQTPPSDASPSPRAPS